jgi:hypothetical protein
MNHPTIPTATADFASTTITKEPIRARRETLPDGADMVERLATAQARFNEGLITADEYDALRAEILGPVLGVVLSSM